MEFLTGLRKSEVLTLEELLKPEILDTEVMTEGMVHSIRKMGEIAFVILRRREGLVQTVFEPGVCAFDLHELKEESAIRVKGTVREESRAPWGREIRLSEITVLSMPEKPMPLAVSKWKLNTSLEAKLNTRPLSLRNIRERAKFRIQEGIGRGFR